LLPGLTPARMAQQQLQQQAQAQQDEVNGLNTTVNELLDDQAANQECSEEKVDAPRFRLQNLAALAEE